MFLKLQNKFLLLNLTLISVMMLVAFTIIYLITYHNTYQDIVMELNMSWDFYSNVQNTNVLPQRPPQQGKDFNQPQPPIRHWNSFAITARATGEIIKVDASVINEDNFYKNTLALAIAKSKTQGEFSLDGSQWAYLKKYMGDQIRIVFLDISSEKAILTKLIYTFLVVALCMLVIIFLISRNFAIRAIAPIQDAFSKQKRFIADASHELRTPLAVLAANLDVIQSNQLESVESQAKWINYMKNEVQRMSQLTNDLLYLTQVDNSHMKVAYSQFDLSQVVETAALTMEGIIYEKNMVLDSHIEPHIMIHGNSEQLKQVILILLDNAIKYANKEGKVQLELKMNKSRSNPVLSVKNTGPGISSKNIDRIFDRFYRVDPSRTKDTGGYGLGLSIAKAIIEEHKGKISVKSEEGSWTNFIITF